MKALVHVSGGLDSAAALLFTLNSGHEVIPVFYDYGQSYAQQERVAAGRLVNALRERVDFMKRLAPLRQHHFDMYTKSNTGVDEYVPYRNLVLAASSANTAAALNCDVVIVGSKTDVVRESDPYSFKDSCFKFYYDFDILVNSITEMGTSRPLIQMPLAGWSKADVVKYLIENRVNHKGLWTCYVAGDEPCGQCYHCNEYTHALGDKRVQEAMHRVIG